MKTEKMCKRNEMTITSLENLTEGCSATALQSEMLETAFLKFNQLPGPKSGLLCAYIVFLAFK